jgi:ADP-dependent NAD(P)H-hydrate dehydratase
MRLATRQQIQDMEKQAEHDLNLSEEDLMETAGCQAAQWILDYVSDLDHKAIAIIAGPGYNGADGLVVARELFKKTKNVSIYTNGSSRPHWKKQFEKIQGIEVYTLAEFGVQADVVIDALFGVGLTKKLGADEVALIETINHANHIISLDIPSGLDCDRGISWGGCVKADQTLAFNLAKPGFFVNDGPSATGKIKVLDIGLKALHKKCADTHFSVSRKWARTHKPNFGEQIHKSDRGRSLLIAGSFKFPGAGILATRAALRSGSGYATLVCDGAAQLAYENPDFLLQDAKEIRLSDLKFDAIGIGPGLGVSTRTQNFIVELKNMKMPRVLVDADALTVCAEKDLFPLPADWIATPHAGELGRILKIDAKEIESDRYHYARLAHEKMGCQVLLKGFHSVLAFDGKVVVIPTGNSALAKSGTGDVLSGMITSFMAQGMTPTRAALFGSYLHGLIADDWIRMRKDAASLIASDLIENLPRCLAKLAI